MSGRRFALLLAAGLLVRCLALPLPGTGDVGIWKAWSFNAVHRGVRTLYGVGHQTPEQRLLRWQDAEWTVDYPPMALYVLDVAGRAYRAFDPAMSDGPGFSVAVKLPPFVAEIGLTILIYMVANRAASRRVAQQAALAYWLNPACLLNGSALGYLDPLFALPVVGAVVAAASGRTWLAGMLMGLGAMMKAQAVLAAPALAIALVGQRDRWAERLLCLGEAALGASVTIVAVLVPYALVGALPNVIQALSRLAAHDMLSGHACNLWWIVTWITRAAYSMHDMGTWAAWTAPTRILAISRFIEVGMPNPRPIGLAMTCAAWAWAVWRTRDARSLSLVAGLGAFVLHAYFFLSAQVHENHLFVAIPLAIVASIERPAWGRLAVALSAIQALDLAFFYGISEGIAVPALPRVYTVVDSTVLLAFVNGVALAFHARVLHRESRLGGSGGVPR